MGIGQTRGKRGVGRGELDHDQARADNGPDFQHQKITACEPGAERDRVWGTGCGCGRHKTFGPIFEFFQNPATSPSFAASLVLPPPNSGWLSSPSSRTTRSASARLFRISYCVL